MVRSFFIVLITGFLSACTHLPDWVNLVPPAQPSHYSFSWRLSGDKPTAPLQVFDNGKQTWLQFQPDQPVPAIFRHTPQGDVPVSYTRQGPYVVLDGVWPELVLRGGQLQSRVERVNAESQEVSVLPVEDNGAVALIEAQHAVSPQDRTMRHTLSRWASASGWTFEPEHWVVDADIPIVGSAVFEGEFTQAVQELLATTELADRPLQPCFYSNRVLRIVPYAQTCDRSAGVGLS